MPAASPDSHLLPSVRPCRLSAQVLVASKSGNHNERSSAQNFNFPDRLADASRTMGRAEIRNRLSPPPHALRNVQNGPFCKHNSVVRNCHRQGPNGKASQRRTSHFERWVLEFRNQFRSSSSRVTPMWHMTESYEIARERGSCAGNHCKDFASPSHELN